MTKLLDEAFVSARRLPPSMQDELARLIMRFAGDDQPPAVLEPEEDEALALSEAAAARNYFATDAEVRRVWAKHGL
jgi:hypothetical protein